MISIIAVGDIVPGGLLSGKKDGYIADEVVQILSKGDIRVGTLETAVGNAPTFSEEKMARAKDVIYVPDRDLEKLKDLNFDIVSLANNHFFDLGESGAEHTIALLDRLGISHIGAGRNIQEASRPEIRVINGKRVAFLAFCDWRESMVGWCPFATETSAGVNPMYDDYVISEIKKNKSKYDFVVVMPHWGKEHQAYPTADVYQLVQKMQKAGADLILGSHPHCIQPISCRRGKGVVYSMGNFLFPDRLIAPPRSTYYPVTPLDLSSLPVTDRYPIVEEVTYKKWKPRARFGLLVEVQINNKVNSIHPNVVHLTQDNMIELFRGSYPFQNQVRLAQIEVRSGMYPIFYLPQQAKLWLKPRVKRVIRLMKK